MREWEWLERWSRYSSYLNHLETRSLPGPISARGALRAHITTDVFVGVRWQVKLKLVPPPTVGKLSWTMDKWEQVFKYAVYIAYEIVAYARCPVGPSWQRPSAKMVSSSYRLFYSFSFRHPNQCALFQFNLLLPQFLRLRKQIDHSGGGLRRPLALNVMAADNVLLETWNVSMKAHDPRSSSAPSSMSKALLELSVFLRSLQSFVHVLPAAARSIRNQNETYTITLSTPSKQTFGDGIDVATYSFKRISSILGVFEFNVSYRAQVEAIGPGIDLPANSDSPGSSNIIKDYVAGPSTSTRVSSNPRQIPTSQRHKSSSSESENERGEHLSLGGRGDRAISFGAMSGSNFSVGTPPLHPSSLGSHARWPMAPASQTSSYRSSGIGFQPMHHIGSGSPSPGTPPFLAGSLKTQGIASPFYKNMSPSITGSSPPFHTMMMGTTPHSHGSSTGGGTPQYPKATPSPLGTSNFIGSSLTQSSLTHGNSSMSNTVGIMNPTSTFGNDVDEVLHSPWGGTLGVVAQRAGKECRYGKVDTTWISGNSKRMIGDGMSSSSRSGYNSIAGGSCSYLADTGDNVVAEETLGWHDGYLETNLILELLNAPHDLTMRFDKPLKGAIAEASEEIESTKVFLREYKVEKKASRK